MINNLEFTSRLKKILTHYSLSASAFAEKVGVQRSSISHLLSGRNKPSLDFVMKISNAFPELNLYWLLNGKGDFLQSHIQAKTLFEAAPKSETPPAPSSLENKDTPTPSVNFKDETIERIVIFYKNGTFKNFKN
ncbi:MAG: helix-turn-helix transcriptional regulator [Flavobacteriaceae bacterium]|nr:helix-turn-helix transcriptional regulator [Flavobacteriaceae bacterium]